MAGNGSNSEEVFTVMPKLCASRNFEFGPGTFKDLLNSIKRLYNICDGCSVGLAYEHERHRNEAIVFGEKTNKPCECHTCKELHQ